LHHTEADPHSYRERSASVEKNYLYQQH